MAPGPRARLSGCCRESGLDRQVVRPSKGFWETGETGHLFQGNKDQILRGTKTILGNREHKKANFRFLGNRGISQFISGEQGNRYHPWEGLSCLESTPPEQTVLNILHVKCELVVKGPFSAVLYVLCCLENQFYVIQAAFRPNKKKWKCLGVRYWTLDSGFGTGLLDTESLYRTPGPKPRLHVCYEEWHGGMVVCTTITV